jgi:hypothetical protein
MMMFRQHIQAPTRERTDNAVLVDRGEDAIVSMADF